MSLPGEKPPGLELSVRVDGPTDAQDVFAAGRARSDASLSSAAPAAGESVELGQLRLPQLHTAGLSVSIGEMGATQNAGAAAPDALASPSPSPSPSASPSRVQSHSSASVAPSPSSSSSHSRTLLLSNLQQQLLAVQPGAARRSTGAGAQRPHHHSSAGTSAAASLDPCTARALVFRSRALFNLLLSHFSLHAAAALSCVSQQWCTHTTHAARQASVTRQQLGGFAYALER